MDDSEETVSSRHDGTGVHMSSQRPWQQQAQDLHRLKPDTVPTPREGSKHRLPPLMKKLSVVSTC